MGSTVEPMVVMASDPMIADAALGASSAPLSPAVVMGLELLHAAKAAARLERATTLKYFIVVIVLFICLFWLGADFATFSSTLKGRRGSSSARGARGNAAPPSTRVVDAGARTPGTSAPKAPASGAWRREGRG